MKMCIRDSFCPTRCAYCSFVSQDMEHAKKLMDPY